MKRSAATKPQRRQGHEEKQSDNPDTPDGGMAFGVAPMVIAIETAGQVYKLAWWTFIKPLAIAPAQEA